MVQSMHFRTIMRERLVSRCGSHEHSTPARPRAYFGVQWLNHLCCVCVCVCVCTCKRSSKRCGIQRICVYMFTCKQRSTSASSSETYPKYSEERRYTIVVYINVYIEYIKRTTFIVISVTRDADRAHARACICFEPRAHKAQVHMWHCIRTHAHTRPMLNKTTRA